MAASTKTVTVAIIGSPNPSRLASAIGKVPVRAYVRNNGPAPIFLSFSPNALINVQAIVDAFFMPADRDGVFVLEPADVLYCAAVGAGGSVSVHTSHAFPLVYSES